MYSIAENLAAVEGMTDELSLVKIALWHRVDDIRWAAFRKLTSQEALIDVALDSNDQEIRTAALQGLSAENQQAVDDLRKKRKLSVEKRRDANLLAGLEDTSTGSEGKLESEAAWIAAAESDNWHVLRRIGEEKNECGRLARIRLTLLENQEFRDRLASMTFRREERYQSYTRDGINVALTRADDHIEVDFYLAGRNVSSAVHQASFASSIPDFSNPRTASDIRNMPSGSGGHSGIMDLQAVVREFLDQPEMRGLDWSRVAKQPSAEFRLVAAERITDQALLESLARGDGSYDVRAAAVRRVHDQAVLEEIIRTDRIPGVRVAAVEGLTDQDALKRVAVRGGHVSWPAMQRISDQAFLEQVARESPSWNIRFDAVGTLTDTTVLELISTSDADGRVRRAAATRLGEIVSGEK